MTRVLQKVICQSFYRQNVGFFLVVLGATVALMRPEEHLALAKYAVYSVSFLALVFMSLWALYTLKTMSFVFKSFSDPRNEFLYLLRLMPAGKQVEYLLGVQFTLLQPILLHSGFVASQAIRFQVWLPVGLISVFLVLAFSIPVWLYIRALRHPNASQNQLAFGFFSWKWKSALPYPVFYLHQLLSKDKMLFFLTKGWSCFLLFGCCILYPTDDYDGRLISLGMLLAALSQSVLILPFHQFEQTHLLIVRNLPTSNLRRFGLHLVVFGLLVLPEMVILYRYFPLSLGVGFFLQSIAFGVSLVMLIHSYLYFRPGLQEDFMRDVFWALIAFFFLIMFKIPTYVLAFFNLALALFQFARFYHRVEYAIEP